MNHLKFLVIVVFSLPIMGCPRPSTTKPIVDIGPAVESNCPLPDTKWMTVVEGYDSKQVLELATKFEASAQTDVQKIKTSGSASGSFSSDYLKAVTEASERTFEVSKDFFETYRAKRDALCSILTMLDRPNISQTTRDRAEELFLDITKSWSEVKDTEQKKSSNQ